MGAALRWKCTVYFRQPGNTPKRQPPGCRKKYTAFGATALVRAVEKEDLQLLREELGRGADPNVRGAEGEPILVLSSLLKNFRIVRELLKAGAQVDLADDNGSTALIVAV